MAESTKKGCSSQSTLYTNVGWALPVRSTFRYHKQQKDFLFKIFEEGEKSNKSSPEEAHMAIRSQFSSNDHWCIAKQIQNLFSRWSTQVRKSSLEELRKQVLNSGKIKLF